jgi:hypothetical protein
MVNHLRFIAYPGTGFADIFYLLCVVVGFAYIIMYANDGDKEYPEAGHNRLAGRCVRDY